MPIPNFCFNEKKKTVFFVLCLEQQAQKKKKKITNTQNVLINKQIQTSQIHQGSFWCKNGNVLPGMVTWRFLLRIATYCL